ncbi:MAG TPA: menaquinone biosynthesis protein [Lacipirellulaceae bacterium]|jgi:chorismate dehydratase|nr:menaquinone biosynthesis protein [Lacipirellulaceae bacterium]
MHSTMRIGAVNYLNSKPLVYDLPALAPSATVSYDLPSRLADSLAAGRLDVALIPSVEFFRAPGHRIVSDACVACRGPVLSVKVQFRVPPREVQSLALDEGSRTSAALAQILLAELHGVRPKLEALPIGCGPESTAADAVLLIGDRAIADAAWEAGIADESGKPYCEVWDLGQKWCEWSGLPFVFAMWIARADTEVGDLAGVLGAARDHGVAHINEIAASEAPLVGVSTKLATSYLSSNLHFVLGRKERRGLRKFYDLCVVHGLAPSGLESVLSEPKQSQAYSR